jgi:hypothetical protein
MHADEDFGYWIGLRTYWRRANSAGLRMIISSVDVNVTGYEFTADAVFGPTNVYKLGYFWFEYPAQVSGLPALVPGKLNWINFPAQRFFPEDISAVSFGFTLLNGYKGYASINQVPIANTLLKIGGVDVDLINGVIPATMGGQ